MPSPSELLADHHSAPRNIGKLMNANATGDVGSIVVGDALRFYIQVKDERITAARFQVFNCQPQLAPASVVTEVVVGRTLDEAWMLSPADLCRHLGGLESDRLPPRIWAIEGLRSAIASYRGEERDADVELDPLLCRCHGIPEDTVRQSIAVMGLKDLDEVVNATGAGSGCGTCRADIPRLLAEKQEPTPAAATAATAGKKPGPKGRMVLIQRISEVVEREIRPSLREVGVDIDLRDLDGTAVLLRVTGATNDEHQRRALETTERLLKELVDQALRVRVQEH